MEYFLGAFAVWLVWLVADHFLEAPPVVWYGIVAVAGIGWQCLIDWDSWWLGVGIGGVAIMIRALVDLATLATDACKVAVLRNARR